MIDVYAILEVDSDASQPEIKAAYRRLARRYHPDLHNDAPQATEHFKQIQAAYALVADPTERDRYHQAWHRYQADQPVRIHARSPLHPRQPRDQVRQVLTMTVSARLARSLHQALIHTWEPRQDFGYHFEPLSQNWFRVKIRLTFTGERWLIEQLSGWVMEQLRIHGIISQ